MTPKATPKNSKVNAPKPEKEDTQKTLKIDKDKEDKKGLQLKEARNALSSLVVEIDAILKAYVHYNTRT